MPTMMKYFTHCWLVTFGCLILSAQAEDGGVKFHKAPKAYPAGAVKAEWPRFLGNTDQPLTGETKLLAELTAEGPAKVWERKMGAGYASPVFSGERLVAFHRLAKEEQILCLKRETGEKLWSYEYPVEYQDRYGYAAGPRASAVIADGRVFTFGVTSWLHALDLETGKVLWKHDAATEYGVPQYFFGSGSSPLVVGGVLIVNLGGSDELCVAAFDVKTGELKWKSKHEWGQSYASPVAAELQGQLRVLVFAGGESKPSTGGLLAVDPLTGNVDDAYFWRAPRYTSVNAASPCLCGPNRVLVTQAYVDSESPCNGAVMLEMTPERKWKQVWTAPELGCHWMTPVYFEDHLYAFSGEKEHACELVCYDAKTGKKLWGEIPSWDLSLADGRKISMGFKRGSLLHCDGKFLCLGEWGTLAWLELSPRGMKVLSRTQPFLAQQSWTLPPVHQGLLYLSQHEKDELTGAEPRLICYDFRANAPP